jgi:hypothetical protein
VGDKTDRLREMREANFARAQKPSTAAKSVPAPARDENDEAVSPKADKGRSSKGSFAKKKKPQR